MPSTQQRALGARLAKVLGIRPSRLPVRGRGAGMHVPSCAHHMHPLGLQTVSVACTFLGECQTWAGGR